MKQILRKINFIIKKKGIYILTTLVVLMIGYVLIYKGGLTENSKIANIYISIGTSLIATGIVTILDLWRELLKENILEKVKSVIFKAGVWEIYKKRDLDKYDELMEGMKDGVDITGYSLRSFFDSYQKVIIRKVSKNSSIKIRMLVVDPESEFSKNREKIEGNVEGNIFKNNIERIKKELSEIKNVEIREIDTPLTTMIFRVDDTMFVGPHFYKKSSKSTLTYELTRDGWLFQEYEEEFERLWQEAK